MRRLALITLGLVLSGQTAWAASNALLSQGASSGGGSGTVTSVSVATANGFSGTVANATTTPAITIIQTGGSQILPSSAYTSDTSGNLFPNVYTGGGGNASPADSGWGVAASLGADTTLQLRFQMPSVIPGGTFKLVAYCLANSTSSQVVKYTVSDADVGIASPSAATLSVETQTTISSWTADNYIMTKTALTSTPVADHVSVVAVTFQHTGWTLAQVLTCRFSEIIE